MIYLIIDRKSDAGCLKISADNGYRKFGPMRYMEYTEREAIRAFRQHYNLVGKHMTKIYV